MLVGTPIGNLGDLSPRAAEVLGSADVLVCEDTRRTRKLLTHAGIGGRRLVSMDAHREAAMAERVVGWIKEGKVVALATDAGMPSVSDPGARLVAAVAMAGRDVEVVPGPSAVLAALVASGLPTDRFVFEGFLPRKGHDRTARLEAIHGEQRTVVFFESPLRLASTLADLARTCGPGRRVAVARELTKLHEEIWRGWLGPAAELAAAFEPRGEQVVVLAGREPGRDAPGDEEVVAALRARLDSGATARDAAHEVAAELGAPRRRVYQLAVSLAAARADDQVGGLPGSGDETAEAQSGQTKRSR